MTFFLYQLFVDNKQIVLSNIVLFIFRQRIGNIEHQFYHEKYYLSFYNINIVGVVQYLR